MRRGAIGWALTMALLSSGCWVSVKYTAVPGSCDGELEYVSTWSLRDHARVAPDDYPDLLCDSDGELTRARRRKMAPSTSHYAVARAMVRAGMFDEAIAALERDLADTHDPRARADDFLLIAEALAARGSDVDARKALAAAASLPVPTEKHDLIAVARVEWILETGRRPEAIPRQTYAWTPSGARAYFRGELHLEQGDTRQARAEFEIALEDALIDETVQDVWLAKLGLARVMQVEGRPAEALRDVNALLAADPEGRWWEAHEGWRLRSDLLLELDDPWSAATSLRRAHELRFEGSADPIGEANLHAQLGRIHSQCKRYDLAYSDHEAAFELYRAEPGATDAAATEAHNVGIAALDLDDPWDALRWFERSAELHRATRFDPWELGHTLMYLATTEHRLELWEPATADFLTALSVLAHSGDEPKIAQLRLDIHRRAGQLFLDLHMCARALEHLDRAGQLSSTEPLELLETQRRELELSLCETLRGSEADAASRRG